jgi:extracellular elastinolytic metalloproteinase
VHNMGEVWCVTLWDARANLIRKYGWDAGNRLMLQLVTDGMALSPPNPNYLQARDAILQAELLDSGGANQNELWNAFAKRGMGSGASVPCQ